MLSTTPVSNDDAMTPPIRRYMRWLVVSMAMYASLLVTSLISLRNIAADELALRATFGLLPVLPLLLLIWAFARYLRECDEMQREIELKSLAVAAASTGIGFLIFGFLGSAGVLNLKGDLVAILVLPVLFGTYGIAKAFVHRNYGA